MSANSPQNPLTKLMTTPPSRSERKSSQSHGLSMLADTKQKIISLACFVFIRGRGGGRNRLLSSLVPVPIWEAVHDLREETSKTCF